MSRKRGYGAFSGPRVEVVVDKTSPRSSGRGREGGREGGRETPLAGEWGVVPQRAAGVGVLHLLTPVRARPPAALGSASPLGRRPACLDHVPSLRQV